MKKLNTLTLITLLSLITLIPSNAQAQNNTPLKTQTSENGPVTNYKNKNNWLHIPTKTIKPVDVFYIYPTSYRKPTGSDKNIADINDPGMRTGAQSAYARQATAFSATANIYAPYYRQADATYALTLPLDQHKKVIEGAPLKDITAAFKYYLKHYNQNRPYIIVAHSQGSDVATHLLETYLKTHPETYKRMIAAYIPGYSITDDYLKNNPHIKFGQNAKDTGVVLSWNTQAPDVKEKNPVLLPNAHVINPITWTTTNTPATATLSRGSWLPDQNGTYHKIKHYADATINKKQGILIATTPSINQWSPGGPGQFPRGIYHSYDIPFYYFDIKHNATVRIKHYLQQNNISEK